MSARAESQPHNAEPAEEGIVDEEESITIVLEPRRLLAKDENSIRVKVSDIGRKLRRIYPDIGSFDVSVSCRHVHGHDEFSAHASCRLKEGERIESAGSHENSSFPQVNLAIRQAFISLREKLELHRLNLR